MLQSNISIINSSHRKSKSNASSPATAAVLTSDILSITTLDIDNLALPILNIVDDGDLILDVEFPNYQDCTRSIPKDRLRVLRSQSISFSSPRILYRVKHENLIKVSPYFRLLLGPNFAEGIAVRKTFEALADSGQDPREVSAEKLARVKIVDDYHTTKTLGRELIFRDLLRVIHGLNPETTPFTTQCWTVLVLMADNYDVVSSISRRLQKASLSHTFRVNTYKNAEELLRQKILIQYHLEKGPRFTTSTKDLIIKGSILIDGVENFKTQAKEAWWDLPHGIESEIAYRRACVLKTIASIQNQFLKLYSSRDPQCKLGYDSSSSCDSFQLGEMIKFLSRKGLLYLISFQPAIYEESDSYTWPEAYRGDIVELISLLRQCPSYQLDQNHKHCGLRSRLMPALEFIKNCIEIGLGISMINGKGPNKSDSHYISWRPKSSVSIEKPAWVSNVNGRSDSDSQIEGAEFQFKQVKSKPPFSVGKKEAMDLFTARSWNWVTETDVDDKSFRNSFGIMI